MKRTMPTSSSTISGPTQSRSTSCRKPRNPVTFPACTVDVMVEKKIFTASPVLPDFRAAWYFGAASFHASCSCSSALLFFSFSFFFCFIASASAVALAPAEICEDRRSFEGRLSFKEANSCTRCPPHSDSRAPDPRSERRGPTERPLPQLPDPASAGTRLAPEGTVRLHSTETPCKELATAVAHTVSHLRRRAELAQQWARCLRLR
mmetsp:Transcript_69822/g.125835  ORF Transcript_69822/g.125835 Transcript_69822/m.125835 type:complete len:206 (+) Transcript_69822:131-748(+)